VSEDYVAYHGWVYLKNAINSHQFGLRIQLKLCHEDDLRVFQDMKRHRKNRAGSGAYRVLTRTHGKQAWYGPVDMLLLTWSHSLSSGAGITLELDSQEEWEKIRLAPALSAGYEEPALDRVEIMMIELDDEGKPINVEQRAKLEKMQRQKKWPKGGPQSIRAARMCNDTDFLQYVVQLNPDKWAPGKVWTGADVAEWMREEIQIDTRRQLDHDPEALQRFEDKIVRPFLRSTM
jgi:hypothetical protein